MADPTAVVDSMAPMYANEMGEQWDEITEERRLQWRVLAYRTYEAHVKNKVEGFKLAIESVEGVQVAPSTPKSWLRGVQEAKNALVWVLEGFTDEIETRVDVPDCVPDDFNLDDPSKNIKAGDTAPDAVAQRLQCGAVHDEENWKCTRAQHPDHWVHWDADSSELDDTDLGEELNGKILATWRNDGTVTSRHPAFDIED